MTTNSFTRKQFDPALHSEFDKVGRDAAKRILFTNFGWHCIDNPDRYDIDLMVYKEAELKNFFGYCEVVVRPCWTHERFEYNTIGILPRKWKTLRGLSGTPKLLNSIIFLSADLQRGLFAEFKDFKDKTRFREAPNKLNANEFMYWVKVGLFKFLTLSPKYRRRYERTS